MARRPAYNSKAEKARREEARQAFAAFFLEAGEDADELMPLLTTWRELQRNLAWHTAAFGQPYNRYRNTPLAQGDFVSLAREHSQMAFYYARTGRAAQHLALQFYEVASNGLLYAYSGCVSERPYSPAELAAMKDEALSR